MADDNTARFRSSDAYGRGAGSQAQASDPLAELARLIGQNDPFADFGADRRPQAQPDSGVPSGVQYGSYPQYDPLPPQPAPAPAYRQDDHRQDDHRQDDHRQDDYHQDHQQDYRQDYRQDPAPQWPEPPRFSDPPPAQNHAQNYTQNYTHDDWPGSQPSPQAYQPRDPFPLPPQNLPPQHLPPVPGFDTPQAYADQGHQPYQDPHPYQQASDYQPERPPFDAPPSFLTADRPGFAQQPFAQPSQPVYPTAPEAGAMPAPHDDEFYDDAPRGGRRKGLMTVAAVLALAVVGTASAVGYRNFFGGPRSASPPPVIRASSEPAKVAPPQTAAVAADPSASKFNYDRFADRGRDEQVVRRDETPIDQRELARTTQPRTVLPGAPVANSPSSRTGTTTAANPPSAIGEPRRVRTVPIKPDEADMAANAPGTSTAQLPPPPTSSRQASVAPAPSRPVETRPADPPARAAAPPPQPRTVTASRNTPAPSANAPLSLSPETVNSAPPPPAAVRDIPPPVSPPPSRQASASPPPRASAGGRFHVQVSSQKSESDAEQSYRSIASRYSGVLGGQPHVVRRADLGSRGIFYRAMVGPFGSREEAVQLCSSLKSAGGDCVVQAN